MVAPRNLPLSGKHSMKLHFAALMSWGGSLWWIAFSLFVLYFFPLIAFSSVLILIYSSLAFSSFQKQPIVLDDGETSKTRQVITYN